MKSVLRFLLWVLTGFVLFAIGAAVGIDDTIDKISKSFTVRFRDGGPTENVEDSISRTRKLLTGVAYGDIL